MEAKEQAEKLKLEAERLADLANERELKETLEREQSGLLIKSELEKLREM